MTKRSMKLRVGTRESALALAQTNAVIDALKEVNSAYEFNLVGMTTTGDQILEKTLSKIGEKSLFTKELETALVSGEVDFVVHSLKDLPTTLPEGLCIGAIIEREEPNDAVVFPKDSQYNFLTDLPDGAIIGTSSLRRIAQLRRKYENFEFKSVRGNLNTRLRKLDNDHVCDALVLAVAGLKRLGWSDRISSSLPTTECLYAVGQGAIAIECRDDDRVVKELLELLNHRETALRCIAERSFMKKLEGGCSVPLGVNSSIDKNILTLEGGVFAFDGQQAIVKTKSIQVPDGTSGKAQLNTFVGIWCGQLKEAEVLQAVKLGESLAEDMLAEGAKELLDKARLDAKDSTL